jgi:hypothetical protein
LVEGRKDRPCAIVLAVDHPDLEAGGHKQVAVAPITHSPPQDMNVAADVIEYLAVGGEGDWSQVASSHTRCFMSQDMIENLGATSGANRWGHLRESSIFGKSLREAECAGFDLGL